jgi:hypothetical protein
VCAARAYSARWLRAGLRRLRRGAPATISVGRYVHGIAYRHGYGDVKQYVNGIVYGIAYRYVYGIAYRYVYGIVYGDRFIRYGQQSVGRCLAGFLDGDLPSRGRSACVSTRRAAREFVG